ncbi:hypothetical protein KC980_01565 [candidate division WWE3 bacterium]|uniref:Toxin n=1 Tax=candidate division WWE3 bacterium TaxID=2053526 RepID=A0A955ECG3_UNCKA|nr:hypothetical protein [candidate division WWE3 bacterium]
MDGQKILNLISSKEVKFTFSPYKNEILTSVKTTEKRHSFIRIIKEIEAGNIIKITSSNNTDDPNHFWLILKVDNYPYVVPAHFDEASNLIVLHTNFPDRRFKKDI